MERREKVTTIDVTISEAIQGMLARRIQRRREAIRVRATVMQTLVKFVLQVAGFCALTKAAFMWDMRAGFVVVGICCFIAAKIFTTSPPENEPPNRPLRR